MEKDMQVSRRQWMAGVAALGTLAAFAPAQAATGKFELTLSDAEWKKRLSPAAYAVLRKEATAAQGASPGRLRLRGVRLAALFVQDEV
jgi:peptide-methionine (R)-S-oxide reductase